jgi:hypothetical protein
LQLLVMHRDRPNAEKLSMTLAGWKNVSTANGVSAEVAPPEIEAASSALATPATTWPNAVETMASAAALEYVHESPSAYVPQSAHVPESTSASVPESASVFGSTAGTGWDVASPATQLPVAEVAPVQPPFGSGAQSPFGSGAQSAPFGQPANSFQGYQPLPQPGYTAQPSYTDQPFQPLTQPFQGHPFQNGQSAYGSPQGYGPQTYGTPPGFAQPQSAAPMYVAPQSGSKSGLIVAIILILVLVAFFSIAIIGAVSVLGGKVNSSFNAISNTLPPAGYQSPNYGTPIDTTPGFDTGIQGDPGSEAPQTIAAGQPAPVPGPPADPNVGALTPFEASSGIQLANVYKRNGTGPVGMVPGENCVVFEPNTTSYAAVYCSSGRMNAAMVKRGWPLDVQETCAAEVQKVIGRAPDYEELLLVKYPELGVEECFVRTKNYSMVSSFQP